MDINDDNDGAWVPCEHNGSGELINSDAAIGSSDASSLTVAIRVPSVAMRQRQ